MLITALEKERKETFRKGKIEGKIEDAKNMLAEGMSISLVSKITGLTVDEILKLISELNSKIPPQRDLDKDR